MFMMGWMLYNMILTFYLGKIKPLFNNNCPQFQFQGGETGFISVIRFLKVLILHHAVFHNNPWQCMRYADPKQDMGPWVSRWPVIPWQIILVVVSGVPPQGCPDSPVESWPSSSSEQQFYTPEGRLSPLWCTIRNQGSRVLLWEIENWKCNNVFQWFNTEQARGAGLTVDDMLRGYSLLVGFVAYFIGFGWNEVDEFRAAIDHELPGVVGNSYIGESFLNHLIDGCSRNREIIIVSRGGSHRVTRKQTNKKDSS